MRIAVYNRFWATAGGGEKFAGGIAEALAAAGHDVTVLGHGEVDLDALGARLSLDLGRVRFRAVDPSPTAVEEASAGYDAFVNASYGSLLRNRSPHGIYVVHFPTIGAPPPTGWRRFALRAVGRLARLTGATLEPARWVRGVYAPEPLGPLTHRWTDGHGVLHVGASASRRLGRIGVLCASRILPGTEPVAVKLQAGGTVLAQRALRRSRVPLQLIGARLLAAPSGSAGASGSVAASGSPGASGSSPRAGSAGGASASGTSGAVPRAGSVGDEASGSGVSVGGVEVHVISAAHVPEGPASDRRLLGISAVAVVGGAPWQWPLQAVHQTLSAAADDLSFLGSYRQVVSNSAFTADWVQRLWALDTPVLNPPVRAQQPGEKAPIILHVGRFFAPEAGHSKRQLELVGAFRSLVASGRAEGWTLHLVGGCDEEGRAYLDTVRAEIGTLPVVVHPNASGDELRALYGSASIYWHATGLGEDPGAHPERMEHFGISTVEAMSAGAVPVVIGVAGQLEVLEDGVDGYHFRSVEELVARTAELIADPAQRARMSEAARRRAERYGETAFATKLAALLSRS